MEITEQLWIDLKQNTLSGILKLLDAADILLANNGDVAISAGLYTYAVEEYGKLVLLSDCVSTDGKVEIDYWKLFGGRDSHKTKFLAAISKMPDECKNIGVDYCGGYFPKGAFPRGWFPDESSVVADFESRKAIFYCGLDKSKNSIVSVPLVGKKSLKTAIDKLETIVLGFKI